MDIAINELTIDDLEQTTKQLRASVSSIDSLHISFGLKRRTKKATISKDSLPSSSVYKKFLNALMYVVRSSSSLLSLTLSNIYLPAAAYLKLIELVAASPNLNFFSLSHMKIPQKQTFFSHVFNFPIKRCYVCLIDVGLNDSDVQYLQTFLSCFSSKYDEFFWESSLRFGHHNLHAEPLTLNISANNFSEQSLLEILNFIKTGVRSLIIQGIPLTNDLASELIAVKLDQCPSLEIISDADIRDSLKFLLENEITDELLEEVDKLLDFDIAIS
ncbi:hypothetical protein GEMRC1_012765 [Eukaryota sp. GEM-RC1]